MWKMMVKKWAPKLEKISFGSHFGLPKRSSFRDFCYKNEDKQNPQKIRKDKQHKNKQKPQQIRSQIAPQS